MKLPTTITQRHFAAGRMKTNEDAAKSTLRGRPKNKDIPWRENFKSSEEGSSSTSEVSLPSLATRNRITGPKLISERTLKNFVAEQRRVREALASRDISIAASNLTEPIGLLSRSESNGIEPIKTTNAADKSLKSTNASHRVTGELSVDSRLLSQTSQISNSSHQKSRTIGVSPLAPRPACRRFQGGSDHEYQILSSKPPHVTGIRRSSYQCSGEITKRSSIGPPTVDTSRINLEILRDPRNHARTPDSEGPTDDQRAQLSEKSAPVESNVHRKSIAINHRVSRGMSNLISNKILNRQSQATNYYKLGDEESQSAYYQPQTAYYQPQTTFSQGPAPDGEDIAAKVQNESASRTATRITFGPVNEEFIASINRNYSTKSEISPDLDVEAFAPPLAVDANQDLSEEFISEIRSLNIKNGRNSAIVPLDFKISDFKISDPMASVNYFNRLRLSASENRQEGFFLHERSRANPKCVPIDALVCSDSETKSFRETSSRSNFQHKEVGRSEDTGEIDNILVGGFNEGLLSPSGYQMANPRPRPSANMLQQSSDKQNASPERRRHMTQELYGSPATVLQRQRTSTSQYRESQICDGVQKLINLTHQSRIGAVTPSKEIHTRGTTSSDGLSIPHHVLSNDGSVFRQGRVSNNKPEALASGSSKKISKPTDTTTEKYKPRRLPEEIPVLNMVVPRTDVRIYPTTRNLTSPASRNESPREQERRKRMLSLGREALPVLKRMAERHSKIFPSADLSETSHKQAESSGSSVLEIHDIVTRAYKNGPNPGHSQVRNPIRQPGQIYHNFQQHSVSHLMPMGQYKLQEYVCAVGEESVTNHVVIQKRRLSLRTESLLAEQEICSSTLLEQGELEFAIRNKNMTYLRMPGESPAQLQRRGFSLTRINSGTFCSVFRGRYRGIEVAIKCPDEIMLKTDSQMMRYRAFQEWRILSHTNHPRILKLYGGILFCDQIWLVTEFVGGGDLYTLLYNRPPEYLRPRVRLNLMEQVCEAISYLHDSVSPRIAHKDLKCNNLLVRHHSFGAYNLGQVGEDLNLRVCDFGDGEEMKSSYLQCCTAATWLYTPPELIGTEDPARPKNATEKVDIWAMGCVFLEIMRCSTPFVHLLDNVAEDRQRDVLRQLYLEGRLDSECRIPSHLPPKLRGFIISCLQYHAGSRPSAQELLMVLRANKAGFLAELTGWQNEWETFQPRRVHDLVVSRVQDLVVPRIHTTMKSSLRNQISVVENSIALATARYPLRQGYQQNKYHLATNREACGGNLAPLRRAETVRGQVHHHHHRQQPPPVYPAQYF